MTGIELKQRLAAILAADVAGYSRLMAGDERTTVASLDAARKVFRTQIESNQGRVIDMAGDSVLAVFETATGAVLAALGVQENLNASSNEVPEDRRMHFRIGVHLGDVIEKADGTIYGDGVNIAARLEGLAEPGGVMVSDSVRNAVRGKVSAGFEDQGEQQVKNIPYPVSVYAVVATDAPGILETFSVTNPVRGFGGRPAIAVLPFDNLSNDPEQVYFADGIADDILTRLAMWRWIPVIARNSSFVYRGKAVDLKKIGAELGARYLLEGSVRKVGDRVRITGQLIDADTGHHIWAQRYDRVLDDIFALQDEITEAIVTALEPAVGHAERTRALQKGTQSLGAWDLFQRGAWHFAQLTQQSFKEAAKYFLAAAERDTQFSIPLACLARVKQLEALFAWTNPAEAIGESYRLALAAKGVDPLDPLALEMVGFACSMTGQHDAAIENAKKSVELNPSYVGGHFSLGMVSLFNGQPAECAAEMETAIRLSPNDYMLPHFFATLSTAHYMMRNFEQSYEIATLGVHEGPHYPLGYRSLANSLGQLGRVEDGNQALAKFLELVPGYRTEMARHAAHFRYDADFEHYMAGLRKLGWNG